MPRLGHKKSRNGCRQCKARHVKCDENKPCSSCARHGVECSLITGNPNAPASAPAPAPTPVKRESSTNASSSKVTKTVPERPRKPPAQAPAPASLPIDYVLNPSMAHPGSTSDSSSPYSQDDTFPFLTKFTHRADTIQPNYWVRDLELMHHWTTEAYLTISAREDLKFMWQIIAPKQAIHHHFLMHELLAYSALHLAYLQADQRRAFYALGSHHQDLAIRALRKMLPNLSPDNAGALFATSALITLSVFGLTSLDARDPNIKSRPVFEDLLDIFALQKGMHSILSSNANYVYGGPFAPVVKDPSDKVPPQPILPHLYDQIPSLVSLLDTAPLSNETRQELQQNLVSFKEILEFSLAPNSDNHELRFLFLWPRSATQNYMDMVKRKESLALILLAYYSVAFHAAEPKYWFMDGWAERLITAIAETVEPDWQPALQWPWNLIMKAPQSEEASQLGTDFALQTQHSQVQDIDAQDQSSLS